MDWAILQFCGLLFFDRQFLFFDITCSNSCAEQSKMRFGCYQLEYEGLLQQMEKSGLSVFNNNWYNIHDFTPVTEAKNWTLLPENVSLSDVINLDLQPSEASEEGNGGALLATGNACWKNSLFVSLTFLWGISKFHEKLIARVEAVSVIPKKEKRVICNSIFSVCFAEKAFHALMHKKLLA